MDMFVENVARFTEAMGVEHAPIIIHLSLVGWPDADTRDAFIKDLTGVDMGANK